MSKWLNNVVAIADGMSSSASSAVKKTITDVPTNNNNGNNVSSNTVNNKNNSENLINSTFEQIDSGLDNIKTKLSMVANILSEDLCVDNVGYKVQEINELKKQVDSLKK